MKESRMESLRLLDERDMVFKQHGLTEHFVDFLKDQGITVKMAGGEGEKYPEIDISDFYWPFLDDEGNIRSGLTSAWPIANYTIEKIVRDSDGIIKFELTDVHTGKSKTYIFSKQRWEDLSEAKKELYKKELEALK